jgi:hypothetical protein
MNRVSFYKRINHFKYGQVGIDEQLSKLLFEVSVLKSLECINENK